MCDCNKTTNISMGCCQPVLGPIEAYYTKFTIDRKLEEITSAITSGCCITPEEVDEKIASAKTEIEAEIPSLSGYATEQWVEDKHYITGVDLSDYALKSEIPVVPTSNTAFTNDAGYITGVDLSNYATLEDIPTVPTNVSAFINDASYVTTSELLQYISNLQQQINSLVSSISACCGSSGETQYRWVTMTGENDYWCSGTTKMSEEKEQSSTDGLTWTDTGNIRSGNTVLEEYCIDCGYSGGSRIQLTYLSETSPTKIANVCSQDVESVDINSRPNPIIFNHCVTQVNSALTSGNTVTTDKRTTVIENGEYADTDMWKGGVSSEITSIGNGAFSGNTTLSSFTIGNFSRITPELQDPDSNIVSIGDYAFKDCSNLKYIQLSHNKQTVPILGTGAFDGCTSLQHIYVYAGLENAFKQAWPQYSSLIVGIV